ncbi:MAG TPA: ABC transporter transmembrane domain-containing protein [Kofleriaceae bacterium]|nr:ABC transporter transmembrane domain-containing protein [Kofleriaceae bacterium]
MDGTGRGQPTYGEAVTDFVAFLVKDYGHARFRDALAGYDAAAPTAVFERIYGRTVAVLETEWAAAEQRGRAAIGVLGVLRAALRLWRPHWRTALSIGIALLVGQAYNTFFGLSLKLVIDKAIVARDSVLLFAILGGLLVGYLFSVVAAVYADYATAKVGAAVSRALRRDLFGHLQRLPVAFFVGAQSGDIMSTFSSDVTDVERAALSRLVDGVFAIVGLLLNIPLLFVLDWRLSTVMLLGIPLVVLGTRITAPRSAQARYAERKALAGVVDGVNEALRAQSVVRVYGLEDHAAGRFDARLGTWSSRFVRASFLNKLVGASASLGVLLVQILVIGFGGYLAFHGTLTTGSLVAFVTLNAVVCGQAYDLTRKVLPPMLSASGAMQRIDELLGEPIDVADAPHAATLAPFAREIRLEDVTFSHTPDRPTLDRVSLTVPMDRTVAFVGASGSGKSTVLNMILRFYDAHLGKVTVDGVDVREVTQASLRAQMGVVFQDTYLYDMSIADNIRLGKLGSTDDEVIAAAKAAEIHDHIASLPRGYDTFVGEGGGKLSGGQRQRIAIARALLRKPAILLFDEATSALDPVAEAAINATVDRLRAGRAVALVTHRLSSARNADCIYVFDRGRLEEQGTHRELLALAGRYAELWRKQSGVEIARDGQPARMTADGLRAIPLFANLADPMLETIAGSLITEHYPEKDSVFEEGDLGDKFYVLARGKVEVVDVDAVLPDRRVAVLSDGDFFGEMALLGDTPRSASIRTLTPCVLLSLKRERFGELMNASAELRVTVEETASRRRPQ